MVKSLLVNEEIQKLINVCKSDSKISGYKLRDAHQKLGEYLGNYICDSMNLADKKIALVIMMRAGFLFSLGVAKSFENKNNAVDLILSTEINVDFSKYDNVVICDAVVNTGKSIFDYIEKFNVKNCMIATNVISDKNLESFNDIDLFTVRISNHSYKGTKEKTIKNGKGPDTGDRLFSSGFFD